MCISQKLFLILMQFYSSILFANFDLESFKSEIRCLLNPEKVQNLVSFPQLSPKFRRDIASRKNFLDKGPQLFIKIFEIMEEKSFKEDISKMIEILDKFFIPAAWLICLTDKVLVENYSREIANRVQHFCFTMRIHLFNFHSELFDFIQFKLNFALEVQNSIQEEFIPPNTSEGGLQGYCVKFKNPMVCEACLRTLNGGFLPLNKVISRERIAQNILQKIQELDMQQSSYSFSQDIVHLLCEVLVEEMHIYPGSLERICKQMDFLCEQNPFNENIRLLIDEFKIETSRILLSKQLKIA
ncbi:TPA: hypothetical protein DEO28_02210 [Candidatus Dependentiae bacterium]|nr:MAG: hypothetical protein UR14_C0009G0011 [candidate division TM6 bacterium GW2011_GWE2_31_21]KKP52548.1 MAG: hypothetical protein UR43_C0012G0017 [candidate division TM6 bacterium GW2011_GWF2_33_332]HBS48454.1 hypothetical protein [Candidatus Dependentiae bacterium]HBZ73303.1 hypothetical protein [Candidatus Dependentiae bacterium]